MATARKIEGGGDVEAGDVHDDVTQDVKQYSAEEVVAEFFRPSDEDAESLTSQTKLRLQVMTLKMTQQKMMQQRRQWNLLLLKRGRV